MATTTAQQRADRERVIKRLERKLDRSHDHVREFNADRQDINRLYAERVIDRDHADMLLAVAQDRYEKATDAKAVKQAKIDREVRLQNNYAIGRMVVGGLLLAFLVWLYCFS